MEIAFLGTGIMGFPMARNLATASAEHHVRAWNRSPEKAQGLAEHGVGVVADAAEAVAGADVVVTMLTDGPATLEVARLMLDGVSDGAVWWQAGTVGLDADRELAALAREHGVAYLDGPVLGTRQPAEQGALIVLASGPAAARERCASLFAAVGSRTVVVSDEAGAGSRLKLVVNGWLGALTVAAADAILLARALDLDPQLFLDTVKGGPLDVAYLQLKGGAMLAGEFDPPSFPLRHAAKDVRLVRDAARAAGAELALPPAILARFEAAEERGHGDADMAAVVLGG